MKIDKSSGPKGSGIRLLKRICTKDDNSSYVVVQITFWVGTLAVET